MRIGASMDTWASISYDDEGNIIPDLGYMDAPLAKPSNSGKLSKKEQEDVISLKQFDARIPNEEAAIAFMEDCQWGDDPYCGHCASENVYRVKSAKPMSHRCRSCKKYFSVRTGTAVAETNLPVRTWLLAIYFVHSARKGISSIQLSKHLGVTQRTAWFLGHRIRKAMEQGDLLVSGVVEIDETYVGGKMKSMHKSQKPGNPMDNKIPVMGFKDHTGKVIAFPMSDTTTKTMERYVLENVEPDSVVYTDGHPGYAGLKDFGFAHEWVNHSVGEFVRGMVTTNGIESFWALLKRGYIGTFHYMSPEHLHRYVSEFAYRYNAGKGNGFRTMKEVLGGMLGKRLTYKALTA